MGFDTQDPSQQAHPQTRDSASLSLARLQSALPITLGGLGLPSMATLAPLSYVGSICTTLSALQPHFGTPYVLVAVRPHLPPPRDGSESASFHRCSATSFRSATARGVPTLARRRDA